MSIISINNISYTYPNNSEPTLHNLSLEFPSGKWISIIGHNGSGKSTLAKLIDGLLPLDSGGITVDGINVDSDHLAQIHQKIGFVFQNPDNQFVGTTVEDDVAFGLENHQVSREEMKFRIQKALQDVGMLSYIHKEPSALSGGQKQRVAIAGVLALQPKILIFDESTSMLDPVARQNILFLLQKLKKERGFTILAITHSTEEATLGDYVVIMDAGRIVANGPTTEILSNVQLLNRYHIGLTFTEQLKTALKMYNLQVPDKYMSEEQMQEWLNLS